MVDCGELSQIVRDLSQIVSNLSQTVAICCNLSAICRDLLQFVRQLLQIVASDASLTRAFSRLGWLRWSSLVVVGRRWSSLVVVGRRWSLVASRAWSWTKNGKKVWGANSNSAVSSPCGALLWLTEVLKLFCGNLQRRCVRLCSRIKRKMIK